MTSTVPAKSQPLHNFNLPRLKWNKDGQSSGHHHHRRRSIKSPSRRPNASSASPVRPSPLRDSVSATLPRLHSPLRDSAALLSGEPQVLGEAVKHSMRCDLTLDSEASSKSKGSLIEYRRNHFRTSAFDSTRNGVYSSNSKQAKEKFEKKPKVAEVDVSENKGSKILIKIPCKDNKQGEEYPQEELLKIDNNGEHGETDEGREAQAEGKNNNNINEEIKTWNLRPRKPLRKPHNATIGAEKGNVSRIPEKNKAQPPLMNANRSGDKEGNCGCGEKEQKELSISAALTKDEIEEDIFAMTGSKPARRPKKRAKNIQKELDFVFPGLWLVSITPDSYKVSENSLKG